MVHHTVKSSFNRVWIGTDEEREKLLKIVLVFNRIIIHVTHFTKWYILNCPETEQITFTKNVFKIMILLMNKEKFSNTVKETTEKATKLHLLPFIQTYKEIAGYTNDVLANHDQMATYHGDLLFTNFKANIQEHFVKMVKRFISTLITKWRHKKSILKR